MASSIFDSQFVKTNNRGESVCIVCNDVVKSAKFWTAHVNGRVHRAAVQKLKEGRKASDVDVVVSRSEAGSSTKRKMETLNKAVALPDKRIKTGINGNSRVPVGFFDNEVSSSSSHLSEDITVDVGLELSVSAPSTSSAAMLLERNPAQQSQTSDLKKNLSENLPEGFFDDRQVDAKIRNVEIKDPLDEEWAKFQKSLKEEEQTSEAIVEEEDAERQLEREIEEIDRQIDEWNRVNQLEQRKSSILASTSADERMVTSEDSDTGDVDFDLDSVLDWRLKRV